MRFPKKNVHRVAGGAGHPRAGSCGSGSGSKATLPLSTDPRHLVGAVSSRATTTSNCRFPPELFHSESQRHGQQGRNSLLPSLPAISHAECSDVEVMSLPKVPAAIILKLPPFFIRRRRPGAQEPPHTTASPGFSSSAFALLITTRRKSRRITPRSTHTIMARDSQELLRQGQI